MKLSPPGLFSTTTDCPHFCDSRSANMRAVMSTPEPGPSGTMKRTVRVGQVCADAGAALVINAQAQRKKAASERRLSMISPGTHECGQARRIKFKSIRARAHAILRPSCISADATAAIALHPLPYCRRITRAGGYCTAAIARRAIVCAARSSPWCRHARNAWRFTRIFRWRRTTCFEPWLPSASLEASTGR